MPIDAYTLIGLTAVLGVLIAVVIYAVARFASAARAAQRPAHPSMADTGVIADAVQEAVVRLRDRGREMQARAEASERLSDEIVASMTSGLLLIDVGGRVRLINPAGRRLLRLYGVVAGDYRELLGLTDLLGVIDEALRERRPIVRRTVRCEHGPDDVAHLGLTVSPVTGSDGRLQSIVCLFTDVTAVLALEEQLRLKDTLARLGELTAGIAHEFRNGLATIHGYARLMDPAELSEQYATYLEGIRGETQALREVVSNFLNFARPVPLTVTPVDLRALVDRAVDEIRGDVTGLGGSLEVDGTFSEIEGDEVLLRQAFSNLCRNAAEACSTVKRSPLITVRGETQSERTCRILFTDNGPGIQPGALQRIFQPFFTTRSNGTGLGLALVQKIVVTHNGRITAWNQDQGGAAFEVILPVRQAQRVA